MVFRKFTASIIAIGHQTTARDLISSDLPHFGKIKAKLQHCYGKTRTKFFSKTDINCCLATRNLFVIVSGYNNTNFVFKKRIIVSLDRYLFVFRQTIAQTTKIKQMMETAPAALSN